MIARAKVLSDPKQWAYGGHCEIQGKHFIILDDAEIHDVGASGQHIIDGMVEVMPETVCRYGGHRKGINLWEKDICSVKTYTKTTWDVYEVEYDLYQWMFYSKKTGDVISFGDETQIKLIGNTIDGLQLTEAK